EEMTYAQNQGIPIKPSKSIYSIDQNLWGRSIESGPLEHPDQEPLPDAFEWATLPEDAPDTPAYLDLEFLEGVPSKVHGQELNPGELIQFVNQFGGAHGAGIIDHIADRLVGIKPRTARGGPEAHTSTLPDRTHDTHS